MGTLNRKIARRYGKAIDLNNFKADGSLETGAPTIYDSAGLLPTSGVAVGTQAYVTANQKLYIRATGGWYNVATVNTTPTIISVADAGGDSSPFTLAPDGSTTTVITITATDSEGFPLTFSAVANSDFNGLATVAQDSSVFTITPKSSDYATTTSGTLTFRASDGVNIASEIATFSLTFEVADSKFTTALIKASGNNGTNTTINDSSSNSPASNTAHTITRYGNTSNQAFTPHHPAGYSFEVVGNTDAIAIDSGYFATNTTWWKSSGFTIEGWVQLTSTDNTAIFDNRSSGTSGFLVNYNNTNAKIAIYANGGWAGTFSTTVPRDGKWHYIALTMSGTSANLYVDGIKDSTTVTVANTATYSYFGKSQNTLGAVQYTPRQSNACEGLYRDFKFTAGAQYTGATMTVPAKRKNSDSNTALFVTMSPFPRDISSNASTVTALGSTNRSVADGPSPYNHEEYDASSHGTSVYFDGTGDYLTVPTSADFNYGTGDYTIEFWHYPETIEVQSIIDQRSQDSPGQNVPLIWLNGAGYYYFYINGSSVMTTGLESVLAKRWHHVVLQKSSNTTKFFINGVHKGSTYTDNLTYIAGGTLYIGKRWSAGPFALDGHIADFRIVKGTAVYNHSGFTPPTAPLTAIANTKLLTCNDTANIFNAAGASNQIALGGDAKSSTSVKKYADASISLDGSGDFITIGDDTNLDFGSEPFTMEGWYKADTTSGDHYLISSSGGTYNAAPSHFGINIYQGNWRVGGFNDKLIGGVGSGVNTGIDTDWHHFAWTHNTQRQINFYVDGAQVGSTVDVSSDTFDCGGSFVIGGFHSNTGYGNWDGHLEDIRITKGLSRYPFVPHATTHTSDASTVLLAAHATTIVDGSSNSRTITSNSAPTVSTSIAPHVGMNSIYFDGTDDFITTAASNDWGFGTSAYTIEFWYKSTDTDGEVVSAFDPSSPYAGWSVRLTNGIVTYYIHNGSSGTGWETFGGSVAINDDKWHHVALTSANGSSTVKCFINGSFTGSNAMSNIHPSSTGYALRIGAAANASSSHWRPTAGYISNVRLSSTERYTNSFTPPTAELTA